VGGNRLGFYLILLCILSLGGASSEHARLSMDPHAKVDVCLHHASLVGLKLDHQRASLTHACMQIPTMCFGLTHIMLAYMQWATNREERRQHQRQSERGKGGRVVEVVDGH
jgi:hypothetical protein